MNKKYIIPASALLLVGIFLAFTSVNKDIREETAPEVLHYNIIEQTRYIDVEEVAHKIITKDPLLLLIDVRSAEEYNKFSLPGAINIPLDSLLLKKNRDYLAQELYDAVFYSNGTSSADIAWILSKRLGYKHNFVLRGGLNAWVDRILRPHPEANIYDREANERLQYRKGASQYFGGGDAAEESSSSDAKPKKVVVKRQKKEVSGGCG